MEQPIAGHPEDLALLGIEVLQEPWLGRLPADLKKVVDLFNCFEGFLDRRALIGVEIILVVLHVLIKSTVMLTHTHTHTHTHTCHRSTVIEHSSCSKRTSTRYWIVSGLSNLRE